MAVEVTFPSEFQPQTLQTPLAFKRPFKSCRKRL